MIKKIIRRASITLVSLVPYYVKLALYHYPVGASLVRKFLNFSLVSPQRVSVININSGLLKGYHMGLDLQKEKSYWLGTWEPKIQQVIKDIVKEGMVIYDIGAHIGYASLLFSKFSGAGGNIFSFEPDIDNFQRLVENTKLNNANNIVPVNLAISNKNGTSFFERTTGDSMGYLLEAKPMSPGIHVTEVATQTLDNFVYQGKNPVPHIIKIDVEGLEGKVIEGMERITREARPIIICEIHNGQVAQQIFQILSSKNYRFFDVEHALVPIDDTKDYHTGHIIAKPL